MNRKKIISVIGPNEKNCPKEVYDFGVMLGKALADGGYFIVCGGLGGLMEAVCKGARESSHYQFGCTIGIIPTLNKEDANKFCDIIIPSGLGIARNQLVVSSGDAVVAVGGGAGTLSEIAFAWQFGKPVICCSGMGGWSEKLAGRAVDETKREKTLEAASVGDVLRLLKSV